MHPEYIIPEPFIFNPLKHDLGYIKRVTSSSAFGEWAGKRFDDLKVFTLHDNSQWALKYHNDKTRYVHLFPARLSPHTFRVKANTMKSAKLYSILIGKDYITGDDLIRSRVLLGLSPVKNSAEAKSIMDMIEMLRY